MLGRIQTKKKSLSALILVTYGLLRTFSNILMVPKAGLEPARISTVDFESTASTDFATSALQVVCGKRVHYTFQRSTCNTYPLFNELSAEKIVAGVTLGSLFERSRACLSGIPAANSTGAACGAPTDDIGDTCGKQHWRSVRRPYGRHRRYLRQTARAQRAAPLRMISTIMCTVHSIISSSALQSSQKQKRRNRMATPF